MVEPIVEAVVAPVVEVIPVVAPVVEVIVAPIVEIIPALPLPPLGLFGL